MNEKNTNETNTSSNNEVVKPQVKLTPREEKIVQLRTEGATYKEIVDILDLPSHVTVYQALSKAKMVRHVGAQAPKVNDAMKSEVIKLRTEQGLTYMELAVRFNVQPQRINKILREAGLTKPRA